MDFTILCQICRRGHLAGIAQWYKNTNFFLNEALQLLFPDPTEASQTFPTANPELNDLSDIQAAKFNSKGCDLPPYLYELILQHINDTDGPNSIQHCNALPHPTNANILPRLAMPTSHIKYKGRGYSTFTLHPANGSISFFNRRLGNTIDAGFIVSMWTQALMGRTRTFIEIAPHTPLSEQDNQHNPYASMPGFRGLLVYSTPEHKCRHVIIEPIQIRGHVMFQDWPAGTYGIAQEMRALIHGIHRDRE